MNVYKQHLNFLPDFMPEYFKESLELSRKRDDSTLIARATKKVGRSEASSDSGRRCIYTGKDERGNNWWYDDEDDYECQRWSGVGYV